MAEFCKPLIYEGDSQKVHGLRTGPQVAQSPYATRRRVCRQLSRGAHSAAAEY
jgi:hypothetical protein